MSNRSSAAGRENRHVAKSLTIGWIWRTHNTPNPASQLVDVEGDEKTERVSRCLEIGEGLRDMNRCERLDGLEFDDELGADAQVKPSLSDLLALVVPSDRDLAGKNDGTPP